MNKAQLIEAITQEQVALQSLLASLTPEQMTRPGVYDRLSIKDILIHLIAWEKMEIGWLQTSLRGETPLRFAPGYVLSEGNRQQVMDSLNEHIFEQNHDKPLSQVLDDFQTVHAQLIELIQSLSYHDLTDPHRFDWWAGEPIYTSIAGNSYAHFKEHRELIEHWLSDDQ